MGLFDLFSELASSFITTADAESPHTGDEHNSAKDAGTGPTTSTAEQRSGSGVKGGASAQTPSAEGDEEAEANKEDVKGGDGKVEGHRPSKTPSEEEDEDEEEEEEEEEEEDDDEPKDPKEKLEEDCARSAECAPHKHHYDDCVERVTKQIDESDDGKASEDCVEEFFHLAHCATACAAPKLFRSLK